MEDKVDVEILQLRDDETEDFVASGLKLFLDLFHVAASFEVLKQVLNMRFYVCLLEAIAVLLTLDVLSFHVFALQALLLPVELKFDIARYSSYGQVFLSQFHNFAFDLFIFDAFELRVFREVCSNDLVSEHCQRLDFISRESL